MASDEPIDYAAQNAEVLGWKSRTFQDIKNRYMQLINSPKRSGDGLDSLKSSTRQHYGVIDQVSFGFNRYLVFVHKGVGRGRPKGSGKVHPKPWLNPVLDADMQKLADIVAGFKADQAVKAIQIR